MRAQAFIVMKSVGMTSGGCNVQFAVHPTTGECICIEINPRVSRSSALASKATGFPIAKIAAKLALGYSLHELRNDLSHLPASFEPTLDYVVVKMPYFNFDKFPTANTRLTSSMKSVGEAMAIGRTFQEAFQKAIESLDREYLGLKYSATEQDETLLEKKLIEPSPERLWLIGMAFRQKWSLEKIQRATTYDPWFLREIESLMATEAQISQISLADLKQSDLLSWKQKGFSDKRVASLLNTTEEKVWNIRHSLCITPTYKRIDSCAAEFPVTTPCLYSSYEEECESRPTSKQKIIVLGSGPNRIGQGLEFDYCCVHAIQAIKDLGFEAIIINCNPSTVSTDYDISDRLYIEPLTLERIHDVVVLEKPLGLMIQCGGQSPLNVGRQLAIRGVPILGTPFPSIDCCEDRGKFRETLKKLSLNQPRNTTVSHKHHAIEAATTIGYPIIVRPSYVIGGASIHLIKNEQELQEYMLNFPSDFDPILVEEALTEGIEVEVDAIADGVDVFICGIIEHLDPVGIHSGDSICSLSPRTLSLQIQHELKDQTQKLALSLRIVGLLNVQFCVVDQKTIYILEVNPRASRTIPLLSKVAALPFVQIAMRCILGQSLLSQGHSGEALHYHFGVKVPVFPFHKMGVKDTALGPRMLSTGEILGIGVTFQEAFAKGATCIDTEHSLSPSVKKELFLISKIDNNSIDRL